MATPTKNPKIRCTDRVEADLVGQIKSGRLKPGDRIPVNRQLADRYGVSLATVNLALLKMADKGHLVRQHDRRRSHPASSVRCRKSLPA